MKYSTKLSDTIHILIFIALGDDEQLSSTKIAESIKTNPAYVRLVKAKAMQDEPSEIIQKALLMIRTEQEEFQVCKVDMTQAVLATLD